MSEITRVRVALESRAYDVIIGRGLLAESGDRVRSLTAARRAGVVSDTNASRLFGGIVRASLETSGFSVSEITVQAGERSKSWRAAGEVLEDLATAGLDRTDLVVALGGGVVGDLAGFCAATYLRGVDFVQLPTTLLSQVDSSVGGKTGVDLAAGKNLAGAFKQPLAVLADMDALASLPAQEWESGLAEVAKVAVLDGEDFLAWLESTASAICERHPADVAEAVRRAVDFKARIVTADERETDLRECLNYGHTLGHALEKVAGYGALPHGVAVGEGIRFAAALAVDAIRAPEPFAARQVELLARLGLSRASGAFDADELRAAMSSDKKARGGIPRFVFADRPGSWRVATVPEQLLMTHLESLTSRLAFEPT